MLDSNIEPYFERQHNHHCFDKDLEDLNVNSIRLRENFRKYKHGFDAAAVGVGHGQSIQAQAGWVAWVANVTSQLLPEYGYVHWHM